MMLTGALAALALVQDPVTVLACPGGQEPIDVETQALIDDPALVRRLCDDASSDDPIGESEAIKAVLTDQADAWNEGDIEGYMAGYWRSPDLRFASGGEVQRGWEATLERYQRRYGAPEKMGRLAFTDLEIDVLSADAALVFGRWTLFREADQPTGLFTLTMRKFDDGWKVAADHTSSAE